MSNIQTKEIATEVSNLLMPMIDGKLTVMDRKFEGRFRGLGDRFNILDDRQHRVEILLESMDRKIDLALDISKMVTRHEVGYSDHEDRIKTLEAQMQVVRKSSRQPKS